MGEHVEGPTVPTSCGGRGLGGIPRVSRVLCVVLVVVYVIGVVLPWSRDFVALVPGYTIPPHFYVWNLFTSGYVEVSGITAVVDVASLVVFGKYLEPLWGHREYLRFVVVVNFLCGLATFVSMLLLFFATGSVNAWFMPRAGFSGVISGFTVALKQLVPEQDIPIAVAFSLRAKHLPTIALLASLGFAVLGFSLESLPFSMHGLVISWVYLRFFQVKDNVVGDHSDSFSFASFFPEMLRPAATVVSNICFNILKMCKCCGSSSWDNQGEQLVTSVVDATDSNRRRARALRVLDQRIQQMKQSANTEVSQQGIQSV